MYDAYLGAVATAAAALIGLLFVAVSVRDDTIFGPNAIPGGEALAITAFIGLVNSFVVSLLGLIPATCCRWRPRDGPHRSFGLRTGCAC